MLAWPAHGPRCSWLHMHGHPCASIVQVHQRCQCSRPPCPTPKGHCAVPSVSASAELCSSCREGLSLLSSAVLLYPYTQAGNTTRVALTDTAVHHRNDMYRILDNQQMLTQLIRPAFALKQLQCSALRGAGRQAGMHHMGRTMHTATPPLTS